MAFEITPVSGFPLPTAEEFPEFIQWQQEGANVGGPNVAVINFVGDNIIASRGTGEHSNVITVRLIPPAPPADAFHLLDTFTGGAGSIVDHLPETAPTGFAWFDNGAPTTNLQLDGAGNLTNPFASSLANDSNTVWTPAPMQVPFSIEIDCTLVDSSALAGTPLVFFYAETQDVTATVLLGVFADGAGGFYPVFQSTGLDEQFAFDASGTHSYAATVTANSVTVTIDGNPAGTFADDFSPFTSVARITVNIDSTDAETSPSIQRVAFDTL